MSIKVTMRFLLITLMFPLFASAQITFTFSGVVKPGQAKFGYNDNDPISFTFTLNPATLNASTLHSSSTATASTLYSWVEETTSNTAIYTSVTGSGTSLLGTWSRPTQTAGAPNARLEITGTNQVKVDITHDNYPLSSLAGAAPFGLTTPNGTPINNLSFTLQFNNAFVAPTSTLPNASTYFSNELGSYSSPDYVFARLIAGSSTVSELSVEFSISNMTISAIPEPSTHALAAGVVALAGAVIHSRRRASRS